jgi:hypothetical protein
MRALLTVACLLTAATALGGCEVFPTTTDAEACAEMPSSVWPWHPIDNARIERLPQAGTQALFPMDIIQIVGTISDPDQFKEPIPVKFECVFRGNQLKSFGWIEPAHFITPFTQ